jgi:hypothetical protein
MLAIFASWFWILQSRWIHSLALTSCFFLVCVCVKLQCFSTYYIRHHDNCQKWYFFCLLYNLDIFYFSYIIVLARTSIAMLNRNSDSRNFCLVANLRRKKLLFFTFTYDACYELFIHSLYLCWSNLVYF